MLRYAGEFSGFRIAAGIGYERSTDRATPATLDPTARLLDRRISRTSRLGVAACRLMHVPTGLFVQGHYTAADYNDAGHVANGYWGSAGGATKKDTAQWLIQAGISKNWFGIGNTAIYGEYGKATDWGAELLGSQLRWQHVDGQLRRRWRRWHRERGLLLHDPELHVPSMV